MDSDSYSYTMFAGQSRDQWGNTLKGQSLKLLWGFYVLAKFDGQDITHSLPLADSGLVPSFLSWARQKAPDLLDFLGPNTHSYFAISPAPTDSDVWNDFILRFRQEYADYL